MSLLITVSSIAPAFATAVNPPDGIGGKNFCTNIDKLGAKLLDKRSKASEKRRTALAAIETRRTENRTKYAEQRRLTQQKNDARIGEEIDKVAQQAKTEAQKDAVAAYRAKLIEARDTYRSSNQAARQKYLTEIDRLTAQNRQTKTTIQSDYTADVEAAIDKAKEKCSTVNPDNKAIRTEFKADLKAALKKYVEAKKQDKGISSGMTAATEIRKSQFKDNAAAYKTKREQARDEMKSSLSSTPALRRNGR